MQTTQMESPDKKEKLQRTLASLSDALEVEIDGEELSFEESESESNAQSQSEIAAVADGHTEVEAPVQDGGLSAQEVEQLKLQLSSRFEEEKHSIVQQYEQKLMAMQASMPNMDLAKKYEEDLEKLKDDQLEQLENIKVAIKTELMSESMEKIKEMTSQLEDAHKSDLQELKDQYEDQIRSLQNEAEKKAELYREYILPLEQEIAQLREQKPEMNESAAIQGSAGLTMTIHNQEIETLREKHSQELDSLMEIHQKDMQQMQKKIQRKMQDLQDQIPADLAAMQEEMENYRKEKDDEIDKIMGDYESKLRDAVEEVRVECNQEKEAEVADVRERLETEIQALRNSLEAADSLADTMSPRSTSSNVQELKTQHVEEINTQQQLMDDIQQRVEQGNQENQKLKEKISELEIHIEEQIEDYESRLKAQRDEYEVLLGRRDREHEEGGNLLTMLRTDLDRLQTERDSTTHTNESILKILSDTVKTNIATEDKINKRLQSVLNEGTRGTTPRLSPTVGVGAQSASGLERPGSASSSQGARRGATQHFAEGASHHEPLQDMAATGIDTSAISMYSDEGLDLSQRISESIFMGPDLEADSEEVIYETSSRLQTAVERLLDMIVDTTRQLHSAQQTQRELVSALAEKKTVLEDATQKCEDLDAHLKQETEAKEYLAVELNKAEGLVQGYQNEKQETDQTIRTLEEKQECLISDLERAQSRLSVLEAASTQLSHREDDLRRQQEVLEKSIGEEELSLLTENSKLNEEKRELLEALDKGKEGLEERVARLSLQLEEQQIESEKVQDDRRSESEDHQAQVEALEKQLKSNKQFLDEQTIEREQERDDFQREIQTLQIALGVKEKKESAEHRLQREVQDLEMQLKEKVEHYNQLLLTKEGLERNLENQEVQTTELQQVTKELEKELEAKTRIEDELREKVTALEAELCKQQGVNEELSTELREAGNYAELNHTIKDLESQLQTIRRAEQQAVQRVKELEDELRSLKSLEQELANDKKVLEAQVYEQLNAISTLKSEVSQLKFGGDQLRAESDEVKDLRKLLEQQRDEADARDKQVDVLTQQLHQYRDEAGDSHAALVAAQSQLRHDDEQKREHGTAIQQTLSALERHNNQLQNEVSSLQERVDATPMSEFTQSLIKEKNEEIDHLNQQLATRRARGQMGDNNMEIERLCEDINEKNKLLSSQSQELDHLRTMLGSQDSQTHAQDTHTRNPLSARDIISKKKHEMEQLRQELQIKDFDLLKALEDAENKTSEIAEKDTQIDQLQFQLETLQGNSKNAEHLTGDLAEKHSQVGQLKFQVESLQAEVHNLTEYQNKLQDDFDTVQGMLDEKMRLIESLNKELETPKPQLEGIDAEIEAQFERQIEDLKRAVREKQNIIDEKEEEMYVLNEKHDELDVDLKEARDFLAQQSDDVEAKEEELQSHAADIAKKDGQIQRQSQDLAAKDTEITALNEQLQHLLSHSQTVAKDTLSSSGSSDHVSRDALVTRDSQINALKEKVRHLEQACAESVSKDNQIRSLQEEIQDLQTVASNAQRVAMGAGEPDKQNIMEEMMALRDNMRDQDNELRTLRQQVSESDACVKEKADNLNATLTQLTKIERQLQDQERGYSEQIMIITKDKRSKMEELQNSLRDAQSRLTGLDTVDSLKQKLSEMRRNHDMEMAEALRKSQYENGEKIEEMQRSFDKQIQELKERMAYEKQRVEEDAAKRLMQQHQEEIRNLIAEHRRQVDALQTPDEFGEADEVHGVLNELCKRIEHESERPDIALLTGDPQADEATVQALLQKVREEGKKVLSLSEQAFLRRHGYNIEVEEIRKAWLDEKDSLLGAIHSLKELLSETHKGRDPSKLADTDGRDWRADLVRAIHHVFAKDRDTTQAELRTFKIVHRDRAGTIEALERKVQEQGVLHADAMHQIYATDRQSMLSEIRDLRTKVNQSKDEKQEENNRILAELRDVEEKYAARERQWQKKVDRAEYKVQQERVIADDIRSSLELERSRNVELTSHLSRERSTQGDTRAEVVGYQSQLAKLQDALEREQNRLLSASTALEDERNKCATVSEQLASEKASNEMYIQELENVKLKSIQHKDKTNSMVEMFKFERLKMTTEKVKRDLEIERERREEASSMLDKERLTVNSLRRELDMERTQHHNTESRFKAKVGELKSVNDQLNQKFQAESKKTSQLKDSLDEERNSQQETVQREKVAIADLQAMVDLERSKMADLQKALERERVKVKDVCMKLENENFSHKGELENEQRLSKQLKTSLDLMEAQKMQLTRQVSCADDRIETLRADREQLLSSLNITKVRLSDLERSTRLSVLGDSNDDVFKRSSKSEVMRLRSENTVLVELVGDIERKLDQTTQHDLEAEDKLAKERAQLECENAALSLKLRTSEKEMAKLRQSLTRAELELERERERLFQPSNEIQAVSDKEKMQRLYGKYLKAESFRKSLVYQKKYLLLLLGGFRDSEQETLVMLAQMGVYPSIQHLNDRLKHPRPYTRFRAAARVVIAVARFKLLVRKWKRSSRTGSTATAAHITQSNGATYIPRLTDYSSRLSYSRSQPIGQSYPSKRHAGDTSGQSGRVSSSSRTLSGGSFGATPPTRDKDRNSLLNGHAHTEDRLSPVAKRQLLSEQVAAEDDVSDADDTMETPTEQEMEDSLNNYIQRLATLEERLGSVSQPTRTFGYQRR